MACITTKLENLLAEVDHNMTAIASSLHTAVVILGTMTRT